MTVKRFRILSYSDYDVERGAYILLDGREAIRRIMAGEQVIVRNRWEAQRGDTGRPLRLNQLLRYNHIYPAGSRWTQFDYWGTKTAVNLTEEDKAFLRWAIRRGRVPDAPTKDPGI